MKRTVCMAVACLALWVVSMPNCLAAEVSLAWDPSATPGDVAGYRIYLGPSSRSYTNSLDAGNVTAFTVGPLRTGSRYFFAATAYAADGTESDFSNEVSWLRLAAPVLHAPNAEIFITTYRVWESTNLVSWTVAATLPVFATLPVDRAAPGHFYRVEQLNVGAPIEIRLTL